MRIRLTLWLGLIALSLSPIGLHAAEPFVQVGSWYEVEMPSSQSDLVKILQTGPGQWCWVLSQTINAPADTNGTLIIQENKFWLNLAQASCIWPSSEIDQKYYQKKYAGGVKVEVVSSP